MATTTLCVIRDGVLLAAYDDDEQGRELAVARARKLRAEIIRIETYGGA